MSYRNLFFEKKITGKLRKISGTIQKNCAVNVILRYDIECHKEIDIQERLGVLAATCAARKRLPLRTSAIHRIEKERL